MDESGIECPPNGVSSTTHETSASAMRSAGTDFVTVLTAPVQCPLNEDGTLSIGTLQSAIPGAGGLYVQDNQTRKALRVDRYDDKIFPPVSGWSSCSEYYVSFYTPARHCSHCCMDQNNAYDKYDRATKQFHQSIALVQRLLGQDVVETEKMHHLATQMTAVSNGEPQEPISDNESEIVRSLRAEVEALRAEVLLRDRTLEELEGRAKVSERVLESQVADLGSALDSTRQELAAEREKGEQRAFAECAEGIRVRELEGKVAELDKNWNDAKVGELEAALNDCNGERATLETRLGEKDGELARISQERDDARWRVGELESELQRKNDELTHSSERVQQLTNEVNDVKNTLDSVQHELHVVREERGDQQASENVLREKEAELARVYQERNDAQWRVGELEAEMQRKNDELAQSVECAQQFSDEIAQLKISLDNVQNELCTLKQEHEKLVIQTESQVQREVVPLLESVPSESDMQQSADGGNGDLPVNVESLRQKVNKLAESKARYKAQCTEYQRNLSIENAERAQMKKQYEESIAELEKSYNDAKWRIGELEAELMSKDGTLHQRIASLEQEVLSVSKERDDAKWRIGEFEAEMQRKSNELSAAENRIRELCAQQYEKQHSPVSNVSPQGFDEFSMHGNNNMIDELSTELRKALDKRCALEQQVDSLTQELQQCRDRLQPMQERINVLERDLWLTAEAKARLENDCSEIQHLRQELDQCRSHVSGLENECSAKQKHILWCEQQIREKDQFIEEKSRALDESFVIHKEPFVDRHKWSLTMWSQLNVAHPLVRTWFELENCNPRDPRMVYLLGSFFNWECAVLMTQHEDGKWGVWIDLPPGRHEFRYLVDGCWRTSSLYGRNWNDYGTENNWRHV